MRKIVLLLALTVVIATSCEKVKTVYYQYEGVTVTRIDRGNEIFFYYGKYDHSQNLNNKPCIKAWYKGFNSAMGGYLLFNSDKTVEARKEIGYFERFGENYHLRYNDTINNGKYCVWFDSIKGKYKNVIYVSESLEYEQRINKENNSKVKVIYPPN